MAPDPPVVHGSGQQEVPIARGARPWRPSGGAGLRPRGPRGAPTQEAVEADIRRIRQVLIVTLGILVAVWGVYFINDELNLGLNRFGNRPLKWSGMPGILGMAFLHGSWDHLWGNTVSFFTLNALLLYFYRGIGPKVLFWTWVGSGVLLWTSGAPGNHIGLSGVIYGLAAFLFVSGVIRKHTILMRVALVVVFLYGSIVWGVLPIEVGVSWQGHLAGTCAGSLLALVMRGEGPQPSPTPDEMEETGEAEDVDGGPAQDLPWENDSAGGVQTGDQHTGEPH